MTISIPTVTALPTAPQRTDPATFATRGDAFAAALPTLVTEMNAATAAMNSQIPAEIATLATAASVVTATAVARRAITSTDTAIAGDKHKLLDCSGTFTLATTAAATLGAGWWCYVRNSGTGSITIDPNAAETVDGVASGIVYPGFTFLLYCDGTNFGLVKVSGYRCEVITSGTSWVCPIGITRPKGRLVGGGGGGGRTGTTNPAPGGGSGAYAEFNFASVAGTGYTYAIGAGGAAGASNSSVGSAGSATTFNTGVVTVTANGGGGGSSGSDTTVSGGTASNGALNINGGGGMGTSAGLGFAGSNPLGQGGMFIASASAGVSASGYGSGGFGSILGVAANAGSNGVLILEY
jgi:hypothetical protein